MIKKKKFDKSSLRWERSLTIFVPPRLIETFVYTIFETRLHAIDTSLYYSTNKRIIRDIKILEFPEIDETRS